MQETDTLHSLRHARDFEELSAVIVRGLTTSQERDLALGRCSEFNFNGRCFVEQNYRQESGIGALSTLPSGPGSVYHIQIPEQTWLVVLGMIAALVALVLFVGP